MKTPSYTNSFELLMNLALKWYPFIHCIESIIEKRPHAIFLMLCEPNEKKKRKKRKYHSSHNVYQPNAMKFIEIHSEYLYKRIPDFRHTFYLKSTMFTLIYLNGNQTIFFINISFITHLKINIFCIAAICFISCFFYRNNLQYILGQQVISCFILSIAFLSNNMHSLWFGNNFIYSGVASVYNFWLSLDFRKPTLWLWSQSK